MPIWGHGSGHRTARRIAAAVTVTAFATGSPDASAAAPKIMRCPGPSLASFAEPSCVGEGEAPSAAVRTSPGCGSMVMTRATVIAEEAEFGVHELDPVDRHLVGLEYWRASNRLPAEFSRMLPAPPLSVAG